MECYAAIKECHRFVVKGYGKIFKKYHMRISWKQHTDYVSTTVCLKIYMYTLTDACEYKN